MVLMLINAKNIQLTINHLKNTFTFYLDMLLRYQTYTYIADVFKGKNSRKYRSFSQLMHIYTKALSIE